jgi:hypothetical protein
MSMNDSAIQYPQPQIVLHHDGMEDVSAIWVLFEAIVETLKITPDHDLRMIADIIRSRINTEGLPRIIKLAQAMLQHPQRLQLFDNTNSLANAAQLPAPN